MRSAIRGLFGLACVLAMAPGGCGCGKPPPIPLDVPAESAAVVFPLPDDGWSDRDPMQGAASAASRDISVYSPKLDKDGRFEVSGQGFTMDFTDSLFAEADAKSAPGLTITPPVPGRTTWASPSQVEFHADKPFDTSIEYTVSLPALTNQRGKKLAAFTARFKPNPEITIAGKIIHYLPTPGKPRAIYVRPIDDRDIGPAQPFIAIFDQPIEIAAAQKLISLTEAKTSRVIPLSLSHPPAGNTFEGEKVDTNSIVLFKMVGSPGFDKTLDLVVKSVDPAVEPHTRSLHAVPLPKIESIGCSESQACKIQGQTIRGPVTTGLEVHFTNRMHNDDVQPHVKVTPVPPKLRVGAYDTQMYIDAKWDPAKTYQVSWTGVKDKFGFTVPDSALTFVTAPRSAQAILREGVMVLDEAAAKDMYVTTRNVKRGQLSVWTVPPGGLESALRSAQENEAPTTFGGPKLIPFDGFAEAHVYGAVRPNDSSVAGRVARAAIDVR